MSSVLLCPKLGRRVIDISGLICHRCLRLTHLARVVQCAVKAAGSPEAMRPVRVEMTSDVHVMKRLVLGALRDATREGGPYRRSLRSR
jgi:hypothetical protein